MRAIRKTGILACSALLISGTVALGQQTDQNQTQSQGSGPIPAYRSPLGGAPDTSAPADSNGQANEQQSLSGVTGLTLGLETTRSYWQPHVEVTGTADSNSNETPGQTNWDTWASVSGGIDVHKITGRSQMILGYVGGGMFPVGDATQSGVSNGIVQSLSFSEQYNFHRSSVSVYEQATYLPESSFGFGGTGSGSLTGGLGSSGLQFGAGQTVLTGRGQNLDETSALEYDFHFSRRTSLTMAGGYSVLHYFDAPLFNYGLANGRAGFNFQATPKDSLAFAYTFGDYLYSGSNGTFQTHTVQVVYGRTISKVLAFQIGGGPEGVISNSSALTGTGPGSGSYSEVLWSLNSSLQYRAGRYGVFGSYSHGASGGSGVLIGSESDTATGGVSRQMSRTFSSAFTGGYSRTSGLPQAGAASGQHYDYWFGGVSFTKPIAETLGLNVSYQAQYQTANSAACLGAVCGGNSLRHLISVGLDWRERPLLF